MLPSSVSLYYKSTLWCVSLFYCKNKGQNLDSECIKSQSFPNQVYFQKCFKNSTCILLWFVLLLVLMSMLVLSTFVQTILAPFDVAN